MSTGIVIKGGGRNVINGVVIDSNKGVVIGGIEVTKDNIKNLKSKGVIGEQVELTNIKVNNIDLLPEK